MTKHVTCVLLVLTWSCVMESDYDDRLTIINRSSKAICFDYELDTTLDVPSVNKKEYFVSVRIDPGDTTTVEVSGSKTQWIKEVSGAKDSTLSIFVFDYDQVLKSDWDSLRSHGVYKRFDRKLKDLDKNNWRVLVE